MRRPEPSDGFLRCFAMNLLWESPWAIASLVLLILHFTSGVPGIFWWLASIIWVVIALVKTRLIEWAGESAARKDPERPNKNPYSTKTTPPEQPGREK